MNANLQTSGCEPERLELFLNGDLSDTQEFAFSLHLDACANCRHSLEQQAADPEAWREAESLLKPSPFDSPGADEVADSRVFPRSARRPMQIQYVLDALGPTDDPQMLGRLGAHEVSGVVGAGGMGIVLKAVDKSLDRTVAIKVLAPQLATSGAARQRFAREAKATAAVLHPNVIAIHSVSNDEVLPYLVMPYIRGTSLQKRLDREGPLSLQEILRIGSQIAAGLAAAHAQGLVHRDIKPANILLEDGVERVTITDFGLARAVDDATITHSGVIAGTPQYMSPEQARGEPVEQRSDLFSLGSVLYAISTGRPPFRADTTYGVIRRIIEDQPTPIREINPDIPEWLCSVIARLMSKRAADRFESAAAVTELLETCLAHVQQPAAVPLPASLLPHSSGRRWMSDSRRNGVIAMLGVLGVSLLLLWQGSAPPDIAGNWKGDDWGAVALEASRPGEYEGTYKEASNDRSGTVQLKWSRLERRFNGTWGDGGERSGKISLRLVGDEIRGAWTTGKNSREEAGTPRLADLLWTRSDVRKAPGNVVKRVLDRKNPRSVAETYVAALLAGDAAAATLAKDRPADPRQIAEFAGSVSVKSLALKSVHVDAPARPTTALAISDPIKLKRKQPDGQREGQLALTLTLSEVGWVVADVDFESEEESDEELAKFQKANPKSAAVPPLTESVMPGTDIESVSAQPTDSESVTTRPTLKYVHHLFPHGSVQLIACSADGRRIAIAYSFTSKRSAEILDANTGETVVSVQLTSQDEFRLLPPTKPNFNVRVEAIAISPDGSVLAVGNSIGQVKLFNAKTGEVVRALDDEQAKLADKETPENLKSIARAMGRVVSLAFSPDGSLLAMCGEPLQDNPLASEGRGASGTDVGRLKVWNVQTGTLKHDLAGHRQANAVAFSARGDMLASAGRWLSDGKEAAGVILWNPRTGARVRSLANDANGQLSVADNTWFVAFSPDDQFVASRSVRFDESGAGTTEIRLMRVGTGIVEWEYKAPHSLNNPAFLPDGKSLAVPSNLSIRFLDTLTGTVSHEIRSLASPRGRGEWNDLAIGSQGRRLAVGGMSSNRGSVEIWDIEDTGTTSARADGGDNQNTQQAALHQFEGDWRIEPDETREKASRYEGVFSFRNGEFEYRLNGKVQFQGKLHVDSGKTPPTFLIERVEGDSQQGVFFLRGLYEFRKDGALWLQVPDTDARPGSSITQPHRLLVLRRQEGDRIDREAEYQAFEGTWRIVSRTIGGAVELGEFGKDGIHVIEDRQLGDAAISLDPSRTPREIDITFTKGPDKGKVLRGIYEWVDGSASNLPRKLLRICLSKTLTEPDEAGHRPMDFMVRAGVLLAVWERTIAGNAPDAGGPPGVGETTAPRER